MIKSRSGRNAVRGDVGVMLGGRERTLRLTFGALAEIEGELGVSSAAELAVRLRKMSATDLWVVVGALLRAAGDGDAALVENERVDVGVIARAVAAAFREVAA